MRLLLTSILLLLSMQAYAVTVFFDDFEGDSIGSGLSETLQWETFSGESSMAIISSGDDGVPCAGGEGQCLFMDSTSWLTTLITLDAGSYEFSFQARQTAVAPESFSSRLFSEIIGTNTGVVLEQRPGIPNTLNPDDTDGYWLYSFAFDVAEADTFLFDIKPCAISCTGTVIDNIEISTTPTVSAVPVPAAAWLFGSALLGFFGFSRRKVIT